MNVKSKDEPGADQARHPKKKYLWLGYGEYSNLIGVGPGRLLDGGMARSPNFFDAIFEMLGMKKKVRRRSEGAE
jgi:hypothetical protein